MHSAKKISGVIITFNEERHIEACINSLIELVDEVVVVDSYSTDKTPEICKEMGVRFIQNEFAGHIEQKNFAVQQASYDIILSLDADERVSEEMFKSINEVKQDWAADGYEFNRFNNYCGKWLRFAWYPDRKLRLWDRNKGQWGGVNPHDRVVMRLGKVTKLKGDILHYAYAEEREHLNQIEKFARIAAKEKLQRGKSVYFIWHLILNPFYRFISTFFIKGGLFDGYYGYLYSKNAAFLNFLKYKYLWQLKTQRFEK